MVWIGSLSSYSNESYALFLNGSHGIKTIEDLKGTVKTRLGADNSGSTNLAFALLAKEILNINVDVVRGYEGTAAIFLAQQRGEVDGAFAALTNVKTGMSEAWAAKKLVPIVQFGRKTRHPELPDVPTGRELVKDPADVALLEFAELPFFTALPIAGPTGLSQDRLDVLQQSFLAAAKDPLLLEDAKKIDFDIDPIGGDVVREALERASKTPPEVMSRYNALLTGTSR
jgi:hypothetical protein